MNEELNKKLAGLNRQELRNKLAEGLLGWALFDETWWIYGNKPVVRVIDFRPDQSLDACFKWLVPKLDIERINLYPATKDRWGCYFDNWYQDYNVAETPALALCLAIEKLIDEGVKK